MPSDEADYLGPYPAGFKNDPDDSTPLPAAVFDALVAQLRDYRDAVSAIYPGQVVRAAFLTGQGRLVEPF